MLIKILSSESQSIQKVSLKLQAAKFFKFAITLVVCSIMLSVCAFAYTERLDGADIVYTFPFVEFSGMLNDVDVSGVRPKASLTFNGEVIDINNFTTNGLLRYRHINFRPNSSTDSSYDVTVRASIPVGEHAETPVGRVYISLQSDIESPSLTIKDRSYVIEFYADLPYFNSWDGNPLTSSDLNIFNGDNLVYLVEPTLIEMVSAYSVNIDGTVYKMQRYKLSYVVENSSGDPITFNSFRYDVNPFSIDLKNPEGDQAYFTQMGIAIYPVTIKVIAPEVVKNYYEAISAGNNDMKQYFGTVNQIDQNKINNANTHRQELNSAASTLNQLESSLDTDIPDTAYDTPSWIVNNAGTLNDYWSIFFGADEDVTPSGLNEHLRNLVVAVVTIAMLSTVMFGVGGLISRLKE